MSDHISDREIYIVTAGNDELSVYADYDDKAEPVDLFIVLNDLSSRLREQSATIEAMMAEINSLKPKAYLEGER